MGTEYPLQIGFTGWSAAALLRPGGAEMAAGGGEVAGRGYPGGVIASSVSDMHRDGRRFLRQYPRPGARVAMLWCLLGLSLLLCQRQW